MSTLKIVHTYESKQELIEEFSKLSNDKLITTLLDTHLSFNNLRNNATNIRHSEIRDREDRLQACVVLLEAELLTRLANTKDQ